MSRTVCRVVPSLVLLLVLMTALVSCAAPFTREKQLLITGETLEGAGAQFVQVGKMFNTAYNAGQVTPEQYRQWAAFATYFQRAYPQAVDTWKAVAKTGDVASQTKLETIIRDLLAGLSTFTQMIMSPTLGTPPPVPAAAGSK